MGNIFPKKKKTSDLRGQQGQSKYFQVITLQTTPKWKIMENLDCFKYN